MMSRQRMLKEKKALIVSFDKEEYDIFQRAMEYTVVNQSVLLRVLIKETILDKYKEKEKITFSYPICNTRSGKRYKSLNVYVEKEEHAFIENIASCTNMTISNFVKFHVMPELQQMIVEKGRTVKI